MALGGCRPVDSVGPEPPFPMSENPRQPLSCAMADRWRIFHAIESEPSRSWQALALGEGGARNSTIEYKIGGAAPLLVGLVVILVREAVFGIPEPICRRQKTMLMHSDVRAREVAAEYYSKAVELLKLGELTNALAAADEALRLRTGRIPERDLDHLITWLLVGRLALELGDVQRSREMVGLVENEIGISEKVKPCINCFRDSSLLLQFLDLHAAIALHEGRMEDSLDFAAWAKRTEARPYFPLSDAMTSGWRRLTSEFEVARRSFAVQRKMLSMESPEVALALADLGRLASENGEVQQGREMVREAVALVTALPRDAMPIPNVLRSLGDAQISLRDYQSALRTLWQEIRARRALGEEGDLLADSHARVAFVAWKLGRHDEAMAMLPFVHGRCNKVGRGLCRRVAEAHATLNQYDDALHILASLGTEKRSSLDASWDLDECERARVTYEAGQHREAVVMARRLLAEAAEPNCGHARCMEVLARESFRLRDFDSSIQEAKRGEICYRIQGSPRSVAAGILIARIYAHRGEDEMARSQLRDSLIDARRVEHEDPSFLSANLDTLAHFEWARGNLEEARMHLLRLGVRDLDSFESLVRFGTEADRMAHSHDLKARLDDLISLQFQSSLGHDEIGRAALSLALSYKGRVEHEIALGYRLIQRFGDERARRQLGDYVVNQSSIARLLHQGDLRVVAELAESEEMERNLGVTAWAIGRGYYSDDQRGKQYRPRIAVERLQGSFFGRSLIEFVVFRPIVAISVDGVPRRGPRRYAACVVTADDIDWIDLGDAEPIEATVRDLYAALARRDAGYETFAHRLFELVVSPMKLGSRGASHLLISPDGMLSLVPLEIARDGAGRFLLEDYQISYLAGGVELVRVWEDLPINEDVVVVSDPDFGDGSRGVGDDRGIRACGRFDGLPGTEREAEGIANYFSISHQYRGRDATEPNIRDLIWKSHGGPGILHFATHGFAWGNLQCGRPPNSRRPWVPMASQVEVGSSPQHLSPTLGSVAMFDSGLVLAGVNDRDQPNFTLDGVDDGVLTGGEILGMPLHSTQLVVLSACETGVGAIRDGERAFSLSRAFGIAGARSVVTTLWSVSDGAMPMMMETMYEHLAKGEMRVNALRRAKLRLLNDPRYKHPYYWAGVVLIGDWRKLRGLRGGWGG